jgi:tetratricopeptide (TPR) repeat protein
MSWLERLIGATPEKKEQKGDRLRAAGRWGEAMLTYEQALDKLARRPPAETERHGRLEAKIRQTRDALAREHGQSADDLIDGGFWEEALEMLTLAIEIGTDEDFQRQLENKRQAIASRWMQATAPAAPVRPDDPQAEAAAAGPETADDEYFLALCHTLPAPVRRAYRHYGKNFQKGYVALNRGDFERAARHLEKAHGANPQADNHIPLELATAYLNLDRGEEARDLLTGYRRHHPQALPAYQLLCEIYWEQGEFAQAARLLDDLPPNLATSRAAAAMRGETFERSGQQEAARDHYRHFLARYGWEPRMAHRLARVCRSLGATEEARRLYRQLIGNGCGCGSSTAPRIRHEYAELCFKDGQHDVALLELYLTLAREAPESAVLYYRRVAQIYAQQGHDHEARRFRALARQLEFSFTNIDPGNDAP